MTHVLIPISLGSYIRINEFMLRSDWCCNCCNSWMDSTAASIVVERKVCMNNFASQILHLDMFQREKRSRESKKRRKKAYKEKKNASKLKLQLE